jgi:hypothetical protein
MSTTSQSLLKKITAAKKEEPSKGWFQEAAQKGGSDGKAIDASRTMQLLSASIGGSNGIPTCNTNGLRERSGIFQINAPRSQSND